MGYLTVLWVAVALAPSHPDKARYLSEAFGLFLFGALSILAVRAHWVAGRLAAVFYRIGIYGSLLLSYLSLRSLLPVINPSSLDAELHALDVWLFGVEPTIWLDQYVTEGRTEWFSFFYFSYFIIVSGTAIGTIVFDRSQQRLSELGLSLLIVYCLGHVGYMLVPGYGPIVALADTFQNPLPPGLWHDMVMRSVAAAGAQKDIFPSLHTAAPSLITLYSVRHRNLAPFSFLWPALIFFNANIIVATVFLRWHYAVDLIFGLALAVAAHFSANYLVRREIADRRTRQLPPIWPECDPGS